MNLSKMVQLFLIAILIIVWGGCSRESQTGADSSKVRSYANALYNRELYEQSIVEYQRYLDNYKVEDNQRANINFVIGNIYFERLHDYKNAMASYLKVKHVYPESELISKIDKQIIACLERLQRSADARQALTEAAGLNQESEIKSRPGAVIARIGDREITRGDLRFQIKQLPEYVRSQFTDKKSKIQFLQQYIATELFYDAARRQQLENDADVIEGAFQAKKNIMVQKYIENEIASRIDIKPDDLELYYKANKENYTEKDENGNITGQKPFLEVRKNVANDLIQEKQQKLYNELLRKMMAAENVKIYEDIVK